MVWNCQMYLSFSPKHSGILNIKRKSTSKVRMWNDLCWLPTLCLPVNDIPVDSKNWLYFPLSNQEQQRLSFSLLQPHRDVPNPNLGSGRKIYTTATATPNTAVVSCIVQHEHGNGKSSENLSRENCKAEKPLRRCSIWFLLKRDELFSVLSNGIQTIFCVYIRRRRERCLEEERCPQENLRPTGKPQLRQAELRRSTALLRRVRANE